MVKNVAASAYGKRRVDPEAVLIVGKGVATETI
jgi:hypothetical protein